MPSNDSQPTGFGSLESSGREIGRSVEVNSPLGRLVAASNSRDPYGRVFTYIASQQCMFLGVRGYPVLGAGMESIR
jgi:hypothetical protein